MPTVGESKILDLDAIENFINSVGSDSITVNTLKGYVQELITEMRKAYVYIYLEPGDLIYRDISYQITQETIHDPDSLDFGKSIEEALEPDTVNWVAHGEVSAGDIHRWDEIILFKKGEGYGSRLYNKLLSMRTDEERRNFMQSIKAEDKRALEEYLTNLRKE